MKKTIFLICFLLMGNFAFSQDNSEAYKELIKKGYSLYRAENYKNSALSYSSAFQLPGQIPPFSDRYSLACSWALAGLSDSAFVVLFRMAEMPKVTFNDVEDIITDQDFIVLYNDKRWQDVKTKLFENAYKTFGFMQRDAGLKYIITDRNSSKVIPTFNSIDSAFTFVNAPARRLIREKNYKEAYQYLKVSLNNYPRSYTFNHDMGDYYMAAGDMTRAFVYYSRALDLKYYGILYDSIALANIDSVLEHGYKELTAKTGEEGFPTENLLLSVANQLLRKGMADKSYSIHKLNIQYHPESFRAYKGMSDYYNSTGNKEKADEFNTKSLHLQYKLPEHFFHSSFDVREYLISRYENVSKERRYNVPVPEAIINALANYFLNNKMPDKAEILNKLKSAGKKFTGTIPEADSTYNTAITNPVCSEHCKTILIDEAHNNYHTATGRYKPFANLVANDGFNVMRGISPFTKKYLENVHVVVIASTKAITHKEIQILNEWIRKGGSLLLITDHDNHPSNDVLESIGVETPDINYTADTLHGTFGIYFDEKDKLLGNHPIINGRNSSEKIRRVNTFTGRTIIGPPGSTVLLPLNSSATDYMTIDPTLRSIPDMIPIQVKGNRSHGVAFTLRKGKVVAVSEAAMLSAQLFPPDGSPVGMNVLGSDNKQFALNIIRWLTGYIK